MWSQKTPTGKYQYFERYKDPITGKHKVTSITIDGNRRTDQKAAERVLEEKIRKALLPVVADAQLTFGELVERYLAYQRETLKPQTAAGNTMKFRAIRRGIGDDALIGSLTAPYVRRALTADSPTTYNERLKHFKACMRWAYREELISDISFLDRLPRLKDQTVREKDAEKFLEKKELRDLLAGMKSEDWKLVTRFLALTGLRIGELIALEGNDVCIKERKICVTKAYSLVTHAVSTTKTETSTREIYIQDDLIPLCRQIFRRRTKIRKTTGEETALFFPDENGGFMEYDAYRKYFKENCERILGRQLSVHALRHTHVALLAENGIALDIISRRLGHSDSSITRDVYFHVTERLRERDNNALKSLKLD